MMNVFRLFFVLGILITTGFYSFGGVNLKNGNFYITYTDINVPGGKPDLAVKRTYNSRSIGKGWFGFGWSSEFETFLKVSADGSIVVHEYGLGARTRFTPRRNIDPSVAVNKIVSEIKKKRSISPSEEKTFRSRLSQNQELRHAYSVQYGITSKIATGTTLHSGDRGGRQTMTKTSNGYERKNASGDIDYFDKSGKLVKRTRNNGYWSELRYKNKKVSSIRDSFGRQIFFEWYGSGHVKKIWSAGDANVSYDYKSGNLVKAKDLQGNIFQYDYDRNHNLTQIRYQDQKKGPRAKGKVTKKIQYSPQNFNVTQVTDEDGSVTKYSHKVNPRNPELHYWVSVTKKGFDDKWYTNKFEYERRRKPDGTIYNYRVVTDLNGVKTETIYSECCSLPLKITRGKDITNFEYNSDGLLTKKTSTRGEFIQIFYHKKLKKIKKVVNKDGWSSFDYDKKGNLVKAVDSNGRAVLLVYNSQGHITKMLDQDPKTKKRRTLAFSYNSMGKPVEISMNRVGKINVLYDNYGKILKVQSKQGPKMAFQVTQAFQNLLKLIKPSGVSLGL